VNAIPEVSSWLPQWVSRDVLVNKQFCPTTELVMNAICACATKNTNFYMYKFHDNSSVFSVCFMFRSIMNCEEIAKLVAEVSDDENSSTVSFPKKIPIQLKGNYQKTWFSSG
jgi:hypothetical protein